MSASPRAAFALLAVAALAVTAAAAQPAPPPAPQAGAYPAPPAPGLPPPTGFGPAPGARAAAPTPPPRHGRPLEAAQVTPEAVAAQAARDGYRVTGPVERGPRHYGVPATNARGETVRLHYGLDGVLHRERFERGLVGGATGTSGPPSEAEARRMAEEAGYRLTGAPVARARHLEAPAQARDGRPVVLHLGRDGLRSVRYAQAEAGPGPGPGPGRGPAAPPPR